MKRRGERQFSDERILGSGQFVQEVLAEADDAVKEKMPSAERAGEAGKPVDRACAAHGVFRHALVGGCRRKACSDIRKAPAGQLVLGLGLSYVETASLLGISASAVGKILTIEERLSQK
jgi:putative transposase